MELNWIQSLQGALRSDYMDSFFRGWHYLDTFAFLVIFLGMVWYFVGKRQSMYLFYIFLFSSIINTFLKNLFNLSRPCQIIHSVGIIHFSSPGLPSGAAQTAAIVAGFILIHSKNSIHQFLGIIFALILCFSRVYLGLHYFTDIMAGLMVGGGLIALYGKYFPLSPQNEKRFLISAFFLPALFLIFQSKFHIQLGLSMGVAAGLLISNKTCDTFTHEREYSLLEVLSAVFGLLLLFEVKNLFVQYKFLFAFAGGIWLSLAGSFIVKKTERLLKYSKSHL